MAASVDLAHCLAFETSVAKRAGVLVSTAYHTPREQSEVENKSCAADLVTNTDKESEKLIFGALKAQFPDFEFIGEESASDEMSLSAKPTWIVDPIDGTTNFVHRNPEIAISIGLAINKVPVVGVIYNPIRDELFTAHTGGGAFLNGAPIHVDSLPKKLSEALLSSNIGYGRDSIAVRHTLGTLEALLASGLRGYRITGSACTSMMAVACGRTSVFYESGPHAWDVCAGTVIVREAGGVVMDIDGQELDICSRNYMVASSYEIAAATGACVYYPVPFNGRKSPPTKSLFG